MQMTWQRSAIILFTLTIAFRSSQADQIGEALTQFETAAVKASKSSFGGKGDSMRTVGSLTRLRAAVEAENWQQAIQLIFEIEYFNQSPEVVQLCCPLLETLR